MALVLHAAAEQLQLRVVAPDRPGVGGSSFLPQRTVQHYPQDLAELCDQLGTSCCNSRLLARTLTAVM